MKKKSLEQKLISIAKVLSITIVILLILLIQDTSIPDNLDHDTVENNIGGYDQKINLYPLIYEFISKNIEEYTKPTEDDLFVETEPHLWPTIYYDTVVDRTYKLYYGEWEVKKIIAEHIRGAFPGAKKLIGTRVIYTQDKVITDEDIINKPSYEIHIIPKNNTYFIGKGYPHQEQLGLNGDYFIWVSHSFGDKMLTKMGAWFFIKDDNTLIMEENHVLYELKRVSHIKSFQSYLTLEGNPIEMPSNITLKDMEVYRHLDTSYKLFYGEWEIKRKISKSGEMEDIQGGKNLLGKKIYYDGVEMKVEGDTRSDPIYNIAILPKSEVPFLGNEYPDQEELELDEDYFTFVQCSFLEDGSLKVPFKLLINAVSQASLRYAGGGKMKQNTVGMEFFIKDDTTLIMLYEDQLYELNRTAYLPEHEFAYELL